MPSKKNAEFMSMLGVRISVGTICSILLAMCGRLASPLQEIMESLKKCKIIHVDETSISLRGKIVWIWIFHNPLTGESFFLLRPGRGTSAVIDVFGDIWNGTIVCHGWTAYKKHTIKRILGASH